MANQLSTRIRSAWQALRGDSSLTRSHTPYSATKQAPFMWPDFRDSKPEWKLFSYEAYVDEGFNLNTLIYSAIMYKVRAMRLAPLRAWTGTPEEREPANPSSPLAKLVARPNVHQSWSEFQDQYIVYINISGNSYTVLDRQSRSGLPTAMYNLRPDRVFIIPGKIDGQNTVIGYLYVPEGLSAFGQLDRLQREQALEDGRATLIAPDDMMHVKLPNPGDPLEGMGEGLPPISPLARSADVDNAVTHFLKLFFDHGISVPGLMSFDDPLSDRDIGRFRERWKELYGGYERWAEEILLVSGAKYQRIGFTFDEMGFDGIDERNESRILGPFGVPPILVGSRLGLLRSTYSNYEQARMAFWQDTMVPEVTLFEAEFQFYLTDNSMFVAYDFGEVPALKKNVVELVSAAKELFSMGVPVNQALTQVGLQIGDVPGGDIGYLPLNLVPVGSEVEEPVIEALPDVEDDTRKALRIVKKKQSKFSGDAKQHLYKQVDEVAISWESRFSNKANDALANDRRAVLARLQRSKAMALQQKATIDWQNVGRDWDNYFNNQASDNWREEFHAVLEGVITDQANAWNIAFGMQFNVRNLFAEEWFEDYLLTFAQDINKTTKDNLSIMLQQAMREGWTVDEMRRQIDAQFDRYMQPGFTPTLTEEEQQWFTDRQPRYRREMIARTETIRASNAGSIALFNDWGVVESKEWLATGDNRTRDTHLVAWSQYSEGGAIGPIPLGASFDVGGSSLSYPGDPRGAPSETVNCRCTVLPFFAEAQGTPEQIAAQQAIIAAEQERRLEQENA